MNGISIDPTVLSIIVGLAAAGVAIVALVTWHKVLLAAVGRAFRSLFTFNGFFWVVNLSCMAYSAQNAGYVFGLYETSGFLIGLALDGLIIVFTQTALAAKARGETKRAGLILLFIVACCLLSTIGNLAHNLHMDITQQTSGVWFQQTIPYVTSLMPLLLIAMAWVADLKIDPLEKENPDVYQKNEDKRLQFQTIQIESHEKREALQTRVIAVEVLRRRNSALRRGKTPGSFRWFWETAVDAGEIIAGVSAQLQALFAPQIAEMKHELETLRQEKADYLAHIERVNGEQMVQFQKAICTYIDQSIENVRRSLSEQNGQGIALVKDQLTDHVNDTLSDLKVAINQDIIALDERLNQTVIASRKAAKSETVIEITSEVQDVINRYPIVLSWLSRAKQSVTLQEIIDGSGHTPQMVYKRHRDGVFRKTRNPDYFRLDSVITWLQTERLPRQKEADNREDNGPEIAPITSVDSLPHTDQIEAIKRDETDANETDNIRDNVETLPPTTTSTVKEKSPDKLDMAVAAMRGNPQITDEELAVILGLKRPVSARFWRLKAAEILAGQLVAQ